MRNEVNILESKKRYDYIPIPLGKEYLMFLHPLTSYPEEKLYTGTFQPWRFDISNPDKVVAESPWIFATYVFPPQPLDTLLENIEPQKRLRLFLLIHCLSNRLKVTESLSISGRTQAINQTMM